MREGKKVIAKRNGSKLVLVKLANSKVSILFSSFCVTKNKQIGSKTLNTGKWITSNFIGPKV
jgi:hypothetical protein